MKSVLNKRLGALVLALLVMLSVTGCGGGTLTLDEAGENLSLVSEDMAKYMADEVGKVLRHAGGTKEKSYPAAVTLTWSTDAAADFYRVQISESEDMSGAWVREVTEPSLALYNCKAGTTYYWSVTAVKGKREVAVSAVGTFSTADDMPRAIYCDGITNMRDLGGWEIGRAHV